MPTPTAQELSAAVQAAELSIQQAQESYQVANEAYLVAQREAIRVRNAAQAPAEAALANLLSTYKERALELAIEAHKCPYTRWGSHIDPDDVRVCHEGLWLTWDINGDYAPERYLATWEALAAPATEETCE